jgi:hypothetical protein
MKIEEAAQYFEVRAQQSGRKYRQKFYSKVAAVLSDISTKGLDSNQIAQIEVELDKLELNPEKEQKHYQYTRKYNYFTKFLVEKFELTPSKYYEERYLAIGMTFGMIAGMVIFYSLQLESGINNGFIFGMPVGMIFGMLWGRKKDKEAQERGQVLGAA